MTLEERLEQFKEFYDLLTGLYCFGDRNTDIAIELLQLTESAIKRLSDELEVSE